MTIYENSTNLVRLDVAISASPLRLIGDVYVPGMLLNRNSFKSTGKVRLGLKGYFQEEFLCGLGRGVYIPSATLHAHQVVTRSCNLDILRNISRDLIVISPTHFLGYITYIQGLAEILVGTSVYGVLEVIAFAISAIRRKVLLVRATFSCGVWNIYAEDVHTPHEWAPGTQIISRKL